MDYKTSTFLGSLLNKSDLTPGVDITRAGVVYLNYVDKNWQSWSCLNKMLAFDIIENKLSIIPIQCSCSFLYETITDISHPTKFYIHQVNVLVVSSLKQLLIFHIQQSFIFTQTYHLCNGRRNETGKENSSLPEKLSIWNTPK